MDNKNLFYAFLTIFVLLGVCFVYAGTTVSLLNPADTSWNLSSTIVFQFSCTTSDANWTHYNATLYIDGVRNTTYGNATGLIINGTTSNFTLAGFGSKSTSYTWNVECCPSSGNATIVVDGIKINCTQASANFTLGTDTVDPSVYIDMPKSTTTYAGFPIKISCHASDSFSGLSTIKLTLTKPSGKTIVEYVESGWERTYQSTETGEAGRYKVDCQVIDVSTRSTDAEQKVFDVIYRSPKSGVAEVEVPEGEITPEGEEGVAAPPTEGAPSEEEAPSKAWIWIVVIVVIVLILYFVLKKKK